MGYREVIQSHAPLTFWLPGEATASFVFDYGTGDKLHAKTDGFAAGTVNNVGGGPSPLGMPVGVFNGSSRYVRTGVSPDVGRLSSTITHECWFYPTTGNPPIESTLHTNINFVGGWFGACVSLRGAAAGVANNSLFVCGTDGVGFNNTHTASGVLTSNVWHHIVVSFTNSSTILAWVDGVRVDSSWTSGPQASPTGQIGAVWCGVMNTNTGLDRYAQGNIFMGATYVYGFTQVLVEEHMQAGLNALGGDRLWLPPMRRRVR